MLPDRSRCVSCKSVQLDNLAVCECRHQQTMNRIVNTSLLTNLDGELQSVHRTYDCALIWLQWLQPHKQMRSSSAITKRFYFGIYYEHCVIIINELSLFRVTDVVAVIWHNAAGASQYKPAVCCRTTECGASAVRKWHDDGRVVGVDGAGWCGICRQWGGWTETAAAAATDQVLMLSYTVSVSVSLQ